jgi:hypothetical protein
MRAILGIASLLMFLWACQNPSASGDDLMRDSPPMIPVQAEILHGALNDSIWIVLTDSLKWSAYFDTLNKAVVLDSATMDPRDLLKRSSEWPGFTNRGAMKCMSKSVGSVTIFSALSSLYDGIELVCYHDQLVFICEHCFNDQWSRCGVGFRRSSYVRDGRLVHQEYESPSTHDKREWELDVCNCMRAFHLDTILIKSKELIYLQQTISQTKAAIN